MSMPVYGAGYDPVKKWKYLQNTFFEAVARKDWEEVSDLLLLNPDLMAQELSYVYPDLPPEYKFSIPVQSHTHNGDRIPAVRKFVRQARKWAPLEKRLPPELAALPEITVYRAGAERPEEAPCRISWTTSPAVAGWFYRRSVARNRPPRHLYRGVILPEKVIWYTNDRQEHEVMQYRNVRKITELDPERFLGENPQEIPLGT